MKFADTLKYKLKDNVNTPIDRIKYNSPTPSVKSSSKVQKKYLSLYDHSSNTNENGNENEISLYISIII